MSIRTKLFLSNGAVVILLLTSLTFIFEHFSRQMILEKIMESNSNSFSQMTENVDSLLKTYEQTADVLYMDDSLQATLLQEIHSLALQHTEYTELIVPLMESIRSTKDIVNFQLFTNNDTFQLGVVRPLSEAPELARRSGCETSAPSYRSLRSWTLEKGAGGENLLRLSQRLNHLDMKACLFVSIDVDVNVLVDFIKAKDNPNQIVFSLSDGKVVFDNASDHAGTVRLEDYWFFPEMNANDDGQLVRTADQEYLLTSRVLDSRNSVNGIQIVFLTQLDALVAGTNAIRTTALVLFVATLAIFVIANYVVSSRLTRRLVELSIKMRKTSLENLQPIQTIKGNDEVSKLGFRFNEMVQRMQRLIREVYESELGRKELELKTKESELYALQTQVNPHYLFNTLNALRGNLLMKGDRENAKIVNLLAKSFRNVLGKSGRMITIAEELDIIETYLNIQAFRFSDRLRFRIDIPKRLHDVAIPKLSLQTLVENTIVHALEPSADGTMIVIRADFDEQQCRLVVEDNGPGIPCDHLTAIRHRLESADQKKDDSLHIGLRNVHQRLRQSFGPNFGLIIESKPREGTRIIINLPLDKPQT
ncbi:sensor histidine kinase [Paenibacillus agaridevorans]|uniref:histidine kinase n=1 Tax=Paenibacillus agaridevorans TaxID=171404 RepID=A0A2R5ELB8_9BACL|nr:sensor histidine kinase [Paenibacillus agaridevorans]GBG07337.1 sensor histidine kinase [Paenibacillus agaridevorans]